MDAFTARFGASEGRVERAPGDVVFVLGDLDPGRTASLAPGDYVEIAQTANLTAVGIVRVSGTLRAPPAGRWRVSLRLGGQDVATLDGWPGRTRRVSDLAANVGGHAGPAEVAVRLTLLET
jgi:hypothetical protein